MGTGGTGAGLAYPTALNPHQFYGPSPWDAPHRLSLTFNYTVPDRVAGDQVSRRRSKVISQMGISPMVL
jgi:hypothetical protein